ncbi:MAG: hypothetical protein R3F61_19805 [Myxococcota bacterium]
MIRALTTLAGIFACSAAIAAEPVVVPEFSFDTNENFALSVMLQAQVVDGLIEAGHIVLDHGVVAREVGDAAVDRCMESPSCPQNILPRLPAQVAVVVKIAREGAALVGHVELWEQSRTSAMEVRDIPIAPGNEHLFVAEVSQATSELLARLPPSTNESLMAAARMISGQSASAGGPVAPQPQPVAPQPVMPQPSLAPVITPVDPRPIAPVPQPAYPQPAYPQPGYPQPQPYPQTSYPQPGVPQPYGQPGPVQPVPGQPGPAFVDLDGGTKKDRSHKGPTPGRANSAVDYGQTDIRKALEGTGLRYRHVLGAEGNLRKSGMDPRDWLYKATPHSGRLVFEPRVGIGIGDTDRQADVRVEITDGNKTGEWYQEGPLPGRRVRGGLFVGYAPVAYFDLGVMAGLQYGKRYFTTGYYRRIGANTDEAASDLLSVDAIQFIVQPRARAYIVPTGPAKPFLFVGGDFRMFDNYQIAQPADVTYPVPVGGVVPGAVGGGGLLIDPSPIVGFFVEGSYIRHFGLRAAAADYLTWEHTKPPPPSGSESTISIVGGVQFRL